MRIAILSDTHNRSSSLRSALAYLQDNEINTLFHCGDVTSIETARLMAGFIVHLVFGNGDTDAMAIRDLLISANPASTGGYIFTGQLDGVSIAATHGHLIGKIKQLTASGSYDYIFRGHTHIKGDNVHGRTRIINPGALGSFHSEGRTLGILDLQTGLLDFPFFEQSS